MNETDEFDELEIETIAAAHLFEDDNCDERQIDEYGDYGNITPHYHNAGCSGCLIIIIIVLLTIFAPALLIAAIRLK